jgi:hypothetical protein
MLVEEESPGTADPQPLTCQASGRADGNGNLDKRAKDSGNGNECDDNYSKQARRWRT